MRVLTIAAAGRNPRRSPTWVHNGQVLIIREAQLDALYRERERACAARLEGLMWDDFPQDAQRLGAAGVAAVVRLGMERSRHHRRNTERDMYLYLTLMFMIGSYFDEDPQLPWARHLLDPDQPLDRLHDRALRYLDTVAGEENELIIRALVRARSQDLASLPSFGAPDCESQTVKLFERIYPTKFQAQGYDASVETARLAVLHAHHYRIPAGAPLLALYLFLLGGGIDKDPVHPWVREILIAPLDAESKITMLHRKGVEFAESVLH